MSQETFGRYETRCVHCGTRLKEIDKPAPQTCQCGRITAHHGKVYEKEADKPKKGEQASMFGSKTDYLD